MAAYLTINFNGSNKEIIFHIGEKPKEKYQGIKPEHIEEIQLDGDELTHAITNLGAATLSKIISVVSGDSFILLACVDFLAEKGFLVKVSSGQRTQDDIYTL